MRFPNVIQVVVVTILLIFSLVGAPLPAFTQTSYTTGFESPTFALGNVQGQNGWGYLSNSPAKGVIETAPVGSPPSFGTQSLAIRTNDVNFFGVANQLYSAIIDPAGETGSTIGGVLVPAPYNQFTATFYYQAPATPVISTRADGRFAELDPSSKGTAAGDPANRYAQIRVINDTNTVAGKVRLEMGWYNTSASLFSVVTVAQNLNWGQWYRIDYRLRLCDGTQGTSPNDTFRLDVSDLNGNVLGTGLGSTWETAWKTGSFGGGTTPRAINGFDFWTQTGPNNALVGYVDNFTEAASNVSNPCLLPTAAGVSISGHVFSGRRPVGDAKVTVTDMNGAAVRASTDSTGRFQFDDVPVGGVVIIQATARGLRFAPQTVEVLDNVTDLNFYAGARN